MTREIVKRLFDDFAIACIVVEDGSWGERFLDRIIDPSQAATAAAEAITDDEMAFPEAALGMFAKVTCIPRAAVGGGLRRLWLGAGIDGETEDVVFLFQEALKEPTALMSGDELNQLGRLPDVVDIYRGQLSGDATDFPTGISWTLSEQVADWFAAPLPRKTARGNVLHARVERSAILALFLERGEQEVVVDTRVFRRQRIDSRPGRADSMPQHLTLRSY